MKPNLRTAPAPPQGWCTLAGKGLAILLCALPAGSPARAAGEQIHAPGGGLIHALGDGQACLKGRGNCVLYPKSVQLPSGRLLMAFEQSTVAASGSAAGQTIPVYRSDDGGASWQPLAQVQAPAYLSSDPAVRDLVSNWTNPYLYVLPEAVAGFPAGTLLLATVVSGDDHFYLEHKQHDPSWEPDNDGDRAAVSIALYSSPDQGASWKLESIVARGGWQGGSAGSQNISAANVHRQVDPLWEPWMMVYAGRLVIYYSDENDYLDYDPATGQPILDPDNDTAEDSRGQILVHRSWDGSAWSAPVVDVAGTVVDRGHGKTEIGGGRPGMTTLVPTTDGQWLMTFEYWGGGEDVRYKLAADPLRLFAADGAAGKGISRLPAVSASSKLGGGGSPVLSRLPDGRLLYNTATSGDIWINASGRSNGQWTRYHAPLGPGYSRTLQPLADSGRVLILRSVWGESAIYHGEFDPGHSAGTYHRWVNRKTGQVLGTGNNATDADIGNRNIPDVRLETAGAVANAATQYWRIARDRQGNVSLLNQSGGREAAIWRRDASAGQRIASWVDQDNTGLWTLVDSGAGQVRLRSVDNPALYLTGTAADAFVTLEPARNDGSQEWQLQ